jgi:hypothetical protein
MKANYSRQFYYDIRHVYYTILDYFSTILIQVKRILTGKIPFIEEIEPVSITQMLWEYGEELEELNNHDYQFSFNHNNFLVKQIRELIKTIDFFDFNYIYDYGVYWCGCLMSEPWGDLDMDEETILNLLLHKHTEVYLVGENSIHTRFMMNEESPLHKFFLKYCDGYGQNISASYKSMRRKALDRMMKKIKDDLERYGDWIEIGHCGNCGVCFFEENGKCPECQSDLTYFQ